MISRPVGSAVIQAQLVAEAGVGEQLPGLAQALLGDQQPALQNPDRTLQHAHVLVEQQVGNAGAVEQGADHAGETEGATRAHGVNGRLADGGPAEQRGGVERGQQRADELEVSDEIIVAKPKATPA